MVVALSCTALDIRKKIFKNWNRLPRKVVETPSLEVFRNGIDVALRDMG